VTRLAEADAAAPRTRLEQEAERLTPALVVGDDVAGMPYEGYRIFTRQLVSALSRHGRVDLVSVGGDAEAGIERIPDWRPLISPELVAAVRRLRPRTLFYIHPATLPALLRARALRAVSGARTILITLEPVSLSASYQLLGRGLWPDLIFVPTLREQRELASLGAYAALVSPGVDTNRFRPPLPGEKAALREKWGLPRDLDIVLHVGHLQMHRNIQALGVVRARPRTLPLALVSGIRGPDSALLRAELAARSVMVLDGYRNDVEELYRAADCYLFPVPGRFGAISLPLSVLEATASNLPVVSTRFGALPERFGDAAGIAFVDSEDQIVPAVDRLLASRSSTRHLVEDCTWEGVLGRLLARVAEIPPRRRGVPRAAGVFAAAAWRQAWRADDIVRQRFWSADLGFRRRPTPAPGSVIAVEPPSPPSPPSPAVAAVATSTVAAISATATNVPAFSKAAGFYGLALETSGPPSAAAVLRRALDDRLPLVCIAGDGLILTADATALLKRYLRDGGAVLLTAGSLTAAPMLECLEAGLGLRLPRLRDCPSSGDGTVTFAGSRPDVAHELAGMRLTVRRPAVALAPEPRLCVVAGTGQGAGMVPAVVEVSVGQGRLLIAADGGQEAEAAAATAPELDRLVAMMAMRSRYGVSAWHPPQRLANLTIDDPALRRGFLGLDFPRLVEEAEGLDFHVTVATIPRELGLAEPSVLALLADKPGRLSACYHGNDHSGYEFYGSSAGRVRFRQRPLADQRRALETAVARVRRFAGATRAHLDRVMVFPHGLCSGELLSVLGELGFLATCNWLDRYPLEAETPPDPDLGQRPADLAWSGFPLLWRRPLWDSSGVLDLFFGRPAMLFGHPRDIERGIPDALQARVQEINQAGGGAIAWRGLEEIAKHAYLQRRLESTEWEVLMTANEACLHNPEPDPRNFRVSRPYLPAGAHLEVESAVAAETKDSGLIAVTVGSNATATVKVVWPDGASLPGRRLSCSIGYG
jgi:glycosyltransferase involved in cell wall biosynthesis